MSNNIIMPKVSSLVDFIKTQAVNDLSTARDKKVFSVTDDELKKVVYVIQASIEKSFNLGSNELIKLQETLGEKTKKSKK